MSNCWWQPFGHIETHVAQQRSVNVPHTSSEPSKQTGNLAPTKLLTLSRIIVGFLRKNVYNTEDVKKWKENVQASCQVSHNSCN
jgi:hypothetical protein